MRRREFFKNAGIGSATLVSLPALADALTAPAFARSSLKKGEPPADPFTILLQGPYEPVARCPDLGLSQVDLCDGSYSTTKIYAVSGLAEADRGNRPVDRDCKTQPAIGNFYGQFAGTLAVYDLPDGALTMEFTSQNTPAVPAGEAGTFFVGTFDLNILEATGIYQSFVGGHNKMVDILRQLADGTFVEYCFCVISRP
jgi:hypothetical protein